MNSPTIQERTEFHRRICPKVTCMQYYSPIWKTEKNHCSTRTTARRINGVEERKGRRKGILNSNPKQNWQKLVIILINLHFIYFFKNTYWLASTNTTLMPSIIHSLSIGRIWTYCSCTLSLFFTKFPVI